MKRARAKPNRSGTQTTEAEGRARRVGKTSEERSSKRVFLAIYIYIKNLMVIYIYIYITAQPSRGGLPLSTGGGWALCGWQGRPPVLRAGPPCAPWRSPLRNTASVGGVRRRGPPGTCPRMVRVLVLGGCWGIKVPGGAGCRVGSGGLGSPGSLLLALRLVSLGPAGLAGMVPPGQGGVWPPHHRAGLTSRMQAGAVRCRVRHVLACGHPTAGSAAGWIKLVKQNWLWSSGC